MPVCNTEKEASSGEPRRSTPYLLSSWDPGRAFDLYKTVVVAVQGACTGADTVGAAYSPKEPGRILLNAVLAADLHTDGNTYRDRNVTLTKAFAGVSRSADFDAYILAGDITNSAAECEYVNLRAMLNLFRRGARVVPELGNHDSGGTSVGTAGEKPFSVAEARFRAFLRYCGIDSGRNYYALEIKGFRFLVLGTEKMLNDDADLSPAQLAWLDKELADAPAGKPVFVIAHQPPRGINGADNPEACLGAQSGEAYAILKKHAAEKTVLYISGHMHRDFGERSFENPEPGLYFLNLPSFLYDDGGGLGAALEVYPDRLLIRPRNFIRGEWVCGEYCIKF